MGPRTPVCSQKQRIPCLLLGVTTEQAIQFCDSDLEPPGGSGQRKSRVTGLPIYFLSSLASAMFACCPAFDTAFMNASALLGVDTLPERMLRNIMCLP